MKSLLLAAWVALPVLPTLQNGPKEGPAPPRFAPMDLFELEFASEPQIYGSRVVYARNGFDVMTDRRRSRLWIVNVDGTGHQPLESGPDAAAPCWSPNGDRIAYLAQVEGKPQIWVLWPETGRTGPITHLVEGPGNLAWSPDGKWIAFTMRVPEETTPMVEMPAAPEGAQWAPRAKVIERTLYRADGEGYLASAFQHVFVVPADGGSPRQLTHGPYHHRGTPVWDAHGLLIAANRRPDAEMEPADTEIWRISFPDGELKQLTDRRGPDQNPVVCEGGRIAYLGFDEHYQGFQRTRLYAMDFDGKKSSEVPSDEELSLDVLAAVPGRGGVFVQYDQRGVTLVSRRDHPLLHPDLPEVRAQVKDVFVKEAVYLGGTELGRPYSSGSFSVNPVQGGNMPACAFTYVRSDRPADVAVGGADGFEVLTALNEGLLANRTLGKVETLWFKSSHDGRQIQGWVVKPPGFDPARKYPLILEIHGGPFANYGDRFAVEMQLYAAAGYVVLYTNPRGSTSYGEEFGNLIHHAYPGNDYDDLMSGVDAAIAQGYVDPGRLFVTGGSGGGVLSAWIVGKTPRFRGAVVSKPVINWYSFVLTADEYPYFYKWWFPGLPWEHLEHYMARSPISLVGNVTTPTMVLTGEEDYRTPISESEQYYQALKLRGIEAALVRIPGSSHAIGARPSHMIAKVLHILAWFGRHGGEPVAPEKQ